MNRRLLLACPLLVISGLLVGCGARQQVPPPPTVPVGGKVYLPGGAPLTGGRIVYKPKEVGRQEASGEIGTDGSYKLTSYNKDDGAVVGDYVVVIEPISYKTGAAVPVNANIPKKYQSSSSDLIVTVKEGASDYPIRLK